MKIESKTTGLGDLPVKTGRRSGKPLLWSVIILFAALSILFWKSYDPQYVHFSNDGPLGAMVAEQNSMPSIVTGLWVDLNWLGSEGIAPSPDVTTLLRLITSPYVYARILPPFSLLFAGICAWYCLRRLGLSPKACILGCFAAGLSSDFFSTTCWGVSSQVVGFGADYLAIGLISDARIKKRWLRISLAGMAVGIGIMEAYDIGALFSLIVAAYVLYQALFVREGALAHRMGLGILRIVLVAGFAAYIASAALTTLIGTQLKGMVQSQSQESKAAKEALKNARQSPEEKRRIKEAIEQSKQALWDYDTAWSLPKKELFQVIIPGIFGYRQNWHMYEDDQPIANQYWGSIGAGPGLPRLSGTGYYGGILVLLASIWAIASSCRKQGSPFTTTQRRLIWFWTAILVISALLAFGKFSFLYRIFFALPYASAIRNPTKFMHIFSWALVIVFAYGIHGIDLVYLRKPVKNGAGGLTNWWGKASSFDKNWFRFCAVTIGFALFGWIVYAANEPKLKEYLETVSVEADNIKAVADYSVASMGIFVIALAAGVSLLMLIFSGRFAGSRQNFALILMGVFLIIDLGMADAPWIVYWDVPYKYASDPIISFLAEKPYEHRVALIPIQLPPPQGNLMINAYGSHWKQQLFPRYNIQCADIIQEPRVAEDKSVFMGNLPPTNFFNLSRFWDLSNTRYLLGPGRDFATQFDPSGKVLRVIQKFNLVPRTLIPTRYPVDYSAQPDPNGDLALMEFLPALNRATLFSNWRIVTDAQCLETLSSTGFDTHQTVLISGTNLPPAAVTNSDQSAGTVEINPNYRSKRIELNADIKAPSVLMLSERYNPKWQVWVDGKPSELLRCDFILRGVYLTPGKHSIVFKFVNTLTMTYISLSAILIGIGMSLVLLFTKDENSDDFEPPTKPAAD